MPTLNPLHGLTAAPFTPFHADGALNLAPIAAYARLLRQNGVGAAFVCGTTGEGPSLSTQERLEIAAAWASFGSEEFRIIVHVGHTSQGDAVRLSGHAREVGAYAVSAMAPYFFKPAMVQDLVDWCVPVAAAAAPLPFYFYHIPSFTGVSFSMSEFLTAAQPRIPTLAGVKFTFEDLADYQCCMAVDGGRFDILFGRDELLLESLKIGARGAIGSTYNYAAPLYLRLIEAFDRGRLDLAMSLQEQAIRMIGLCNGIGVTHLAASKTLMPALGVDCGPVRTPLRQPTPEQGALLRRQLKEMEFSSLACRPIA